MEGTASLINVGTLVSGGILTAVTGLFWFAYTHPRSYMKVSSVALLLIAAINLAWLGFTVGFRIGAESALEYSSLSDPKPAFDTDPFGLLPVLIFGGLALFIMFLQVIHKLKDD